MKKGYTQPKTKQLKQNIFKSMSIHWFNWTVSIGIEFDVEKEVDFRIEFNLEKKFDIEKQFDVGIEFQNKIKFDIEKELNVEIEFDMEI